MTSITTILLFFIYTWGLGFTATYWLKKADNLLERHFMNVGIGLGVFALLSVALNALRIPLDWKIFLVLSLIIPIYDISKKIKNNQFKKPEVKLTKSTAAILLAVLIASASFIVYATGAFKYPYLEDEDPWGHSEGIKYVSIEKTAFDPLITDPVTGNTRDVALPYMDPYPPAYDILLGILHQTSPDITWTMKFFNALIISLGFIFFYIFSRHFMKSTTAALFATLVLASLPSYLSHFIWAHSLIITLFFPAMYSFEAIKDDRKWGFVAAMMIGAIWVTQNMEQPIKLSTMIFLYLLVVSIASRKLFTHGFAALVGGMALSFFWWIPMFSKYSVSGVITILQPSLKKTAFVSSGTEQSSGIISEMIGKGTALLKSITNPGGTASRAYTFEDFFIASHQNQINTPIGIGIVVSLLAVIGIAFLLWKHRLNIVKSENCWIVVALVWLIYTFWGVNGMTFPVSIARGAFRTWMLLAIPIALISAQGFILLKEIFRTNLAKTAVTLVVIVGILLTSASQKYTLNTAVWPTSSAFTSPQEAFEYGAWAKTLPPNTKVFMYTPRPKIMVGLGKMSCNWCQEELDFRSTILEQDAQSLHQFLKTRGYEYFIVNGNMDRIQFTKRFGENKTSELLPTRYKEIIASGLFGLQYQKEEMFVVLSVI